MTSSNSAPVSATVPAPVSGSVPAPVQTLVPTSVPSAMLTRPGNGWARYGWLMGAVWLVFLYFPVQSTLESAAPEPAIIMSWVGIVSFALCYLAGFIIGIRKTFLLGSRLTRAIFFVTVCCAAVTIPAIGYEATAFLPFLMSYASYVLGRRWHWIVTIGAIVTVLVAVGAAVATGERPPFTLVGIVTLLAIVNTVSTMLTARSIEDDKLRVELATSEQRESIARDVHDLLGHSLTVIKLKAELASKLMERDPERARAEIAEISRVAGEAIDGVRTTVTGLRAQGLTEQLTASTSALESAGVAVTVDGSPDALSPAQSLTAAWILREATTNVLRHSGATAVRISIAPGELSVHDNGSGATAEPGNGRLGMEERAAAAGARLTLSAGRAYSAGDANPAGDAGSGHSASSGGTEVRLTW